MYRVCWTFKESEYKEKIIIKHWFRSIRKTNDKPFQIIFLDCIYRSYTIKKKNTKWPERICININGDDPDVFDVKVYFYNLPLKKKCFDTKSECEKIKIKIRKSKKRKGYKYWPLTGPETTVTIGEAQP
jgi:hypothetical protein